MMKRRAKETNICSSLVQRSYTNNCPAHMPGFSDDNERDFAYICKQSPAFIDKTYAINDVIVTHRMILTAPRHFGKSVNISMLKYFFEIEVNKETAEPITQVDICKEAVTDTYNYKLFQNLAVHRLHPKVMENCFGRNPVIHMDFSLRTSINSYQDAVSHCKNVVREAFKQHSYLLNSTKWRFGEDKIMKKYCDNEEYRKLQQSNDTLWIHDITVLITCLFEHFGRKCIFLVDEFDAVFRASLASTDQATFEKCRNLYKSLIDFPINNYCCDEIDTVVLSGISHMAIYGTKDLYRLRVCAFLRGYHPWCKKLFDFHGFTQREFDFLMNKHKIPTDVRKQATEYYGYSAMKNTDMKFYNPYSVARFLQTKIIQTYWSNSEFFEKYNFTLNFRTTDLIIKQLVFEQTLESSQQGCPMRFYVIERLHDENPKNEDVTHYLMACLYEQGYLKIVEYCGTDFTRECSMMVKIANKEAKIALIEELKKYYRTCGKFDWDSMKACAEHFDDIDFASNPDLRKIYSLLEKYCCGFFTMNEESISKVRPYESESLVIEQYFRRLLYNVASLTKHKTTIIDPNEYSTSPYRKILLSILNTPDLQMCSNEGCVMIQAKYDTTAQEVLNQLILHSYRDKTIKYVLIGLNLSKDKRLSMSAKIGNDFFTYGSEDSS